MTKNTSFGFASRLACGILLIGVIAQSAKATIQCDQVFLPAPLGAHVSTDLPIKTFYFGRIDRKSPLGKQVQSLTKTLEKASENSGKYPWLSEFFLIANIPKGTEELQYLGYNLMHNTLKEADLDLPNMGSVYVSVKPLSMHEVIEYVQTQARVHQDDTKTRDKIEAKLEMIAAMVGTPKERVIFTSFIYGNGALDVDRHGVGAQVRSLTILNSSTGLTVQINFFIPPSRYSL